MKRLALTIAALLLCAPLMAGCAPGSPGSAGDLPRNPDAPPVAGPGAGGASPALGLVNLWRVAGAEGEPADTWLRLDSQEFQLWRDCGMITGSWKAGQGHFLAAAWGAMGDCAIGTMPEVPWLDRASRYVAAAGGYNMVDSGGHVVATLTIDGAPQPIATAAEFFAKAPQITPDVKKAFRSPSKLAAGLTPVSTDALLGKWVPVAYAVKTDPHVVFTADGRWKGSDGCNGGAGRWVVGEGGELLATTGPSTLIGCEGAPVPTWVGQATTAGFDKGWLLLFDTDGNEIGRLERG